MDRRLDALRRLIFFQHHRSFSNDRSFRLHFRLEGVPVIRFYVFVFYGIQGGVCGGPHVVSAVSG